MGACHLGLGTRDLRGKGRDILRKGDTVLKMSKSATVRTSGRSTDTGRSQGCADAGCSLPRRLYAFHNSRIRLQGFGSPRRVDPGVDLQAPSQGSSRRQFSGSTNHPSSSSPVFTQSGPTVPTAGHETPPNEQELLFHASSSASRSLSLSTQYTSGTLSSSVW